MGLPWEGSVNTETFALPGAQRATFSHLGLASLKPGSRTNRNIDSCQVQRVLMSQICFSLMVQGIVDSLLIHTGLLRVSPCPCLFCFERRFGNWITREIHIWVWFKDQQVGAVSSGLGLGFGSERTKPLFTWQGKDAVTTARSQPPPTAG